MKRCIFSWKPRVTRFLFSKNENRKQKFLLCVFLGVIKASYRILHMFSLIPSSNMIMITLSEALGIVQKGTKTERGKLKKFQVFYPQDIESCYLATASRCMKLWSLNWITIDWKIIGKLLNQSYHQWWRKLSLQMIMLSLSLSFLVKLLPFGNLGKEIHTYILS